MLYRPLCVGALAALISAVTPGAAAQAAHQDRLPASSPVSLNADGTVSVKSEGVTVRVLLEALETACPIEVRLDDKAAARAVWIEAEKLSPAAAVGEVLNSSGLNFAMHTRCGTLERPALVVVRVAGDGLMVTLAPRIDPDDQRGRRAALEEPPALPAGPSPEPAQRHDDPDNRPPGMLVAVSSEKHEAAPGEFTGRQMVEKLAVRPGQKAAAAASPIIELPFTQENGQPYLQLRPPKSGTVILPFPDANGNLVEVPVPTGPRSRTADFPVANPQVPNKSGGNAAGNAPASTTQTGVRGPGRGGSDR